MQDNSIVGLYWKRDEAAITATADKYGSYLRKIAYSILANLEDSEESVNDTYLKAWDSMPTHRPEVLSTYLGKITRRTAIDLFRKRKATKRKGSEYALSLDELEECVSSDGNPEQSMEMQALIDGICSYLRTLPQKNRDIFVCRYYFMDSVAEIADYLGLSQSNVKVILHRSRQGLKEYLAKEVLC